MITSIVYLSGLFIASTYGWISLVRNVVLYLKLENPEKNNITIKRIENITALTFMLTVTLFMLFIGFTVKYVR